MPTLTLPSSIFLVTSPAVPLLILVALAKHPYYFHAPTYTSWLPTLSSIMHPSYSLPPASRPVPYSSYKVGSFSHNPAPNAASYSPYFPPLFPLSGSSSYGLSLAAPNIKNLAMVRLVTLEDYLTWQTQFHVVLLSHGLLGLMDGSYPPPFPTITSSDGETYLNPNYQSWLRLNQSIYS